MPSSRVCTTLSPPWVYHPVHPWVYPPCCPVLQRAPGPLQVRAWAREEALGSRRRKPAGEETSGLSGAQKCVSSYARARRITRAPAHEIG